MATVRKTIIVTEQQDGYIKAQVEAGDYTNDSEYVRALIRRDQEDKLNVLRAALLEGEQSGEARRVDPAEFKKRMAERVAKFANA